jgi:hypothetical protein
VSRVLLLNTEGHKKDICLSVSVVLFLQYFFSGVHTNFTLFWRSGVYSSSLFVSFLFSYFISTFCGVTFSPFLRLTNLLDEPYVSVFETCRNPFQKGLWLFWGQKVGQHHINKNVLFL